MTLKDTSFVDLMLRRVCNVLLVANPYDAFMLEDDGRVDEKIFSEYARLGLRFPPRFIQVASLQEAEIQMASGNIDLIICMPAAENNDVFQIARTIKEEHPQTPIVVLTPFSHGITRRMKDEDLSAFEYVFCWLGNTELLLSIIKLIEDKMNIDHDIREAGVQMILLVEDSIRFYSSILPNLYNYILQQSQRFSKEALNSHAAAQRKRGRPKVVLARNYEEAMAIYEKYHDNTLGVISDARYPMKQCITDQRPLGRPGGEGSDPEAGLKLLREIRRRDEYVPVILQSAESDNRYKAEQEGFLFIDKNSKTMNIDLRLLIEEHMGFGDFIFRDPETRNEIARIVGMGALKYFILKVDARKNMLFNPEESIDFNGNTGPFIQYTHARIRSILRKSGDVANVQNVQTTPNEKEVELIQKMSEYGAAVAQAGKDYSPSGIANYCYELTKEFNQFYHDYSILKEEDEQKRMFRLVLAKNVAKILKNGMALLGIEVPERM